MKRYFKGSHSASWLNIQHVPRGVRYVYRRKLETAYTIRFQLPKQ
jgi:hypothetical protein